MTILDLSVHIRPCPRETVFFGEGAFGPNSRFRPEAMQHLKNTQGTDDLIFPMLVDDKTQTFDQDNNHHNPLVVTQSYDILTHLWENYGQSVESSSDAQLRRPDQIVNSTSIPFVLRFLLLSTPSYLRPWPRCGVMRFSSTWDESNEEITLYQSEGCPESRLVREALCSLEIPHLSIPVARGSSNLQLLQNELDKRLEDNVEQRHQDSLPVLIDRNKGTTCMVGAKDCVEYLWKTYSDESQPSPTWFDPAPATNLGRKGGSLSVGVYTAFLKGSREFVPQRAMD